MLKKIFIFIVIIISIIIVGTPLYNLAIGRKIGILAYYYSEDLPIEVTKDDVSTLYILNNNEESSKIDPTTVTYTNKNGFDKTCELLLAVNKNSTINYNNIVISLNNNIMYLSDLILDYDEYYYYFPIGTKTVGAYSTDTDLFRMWLKGDSENLTSTSSISITFVTK
jgi:hypothetical protein